MDNMFIVMVAGAMPPSSKTEAVMLSKVKVNLNLFPPRASVCRRVRPTYRYSFSSPLRHKQGAIRLRRVGVVVAQQQGDTVTKQSWH